MNRKLLLPLAIVLLAARPGAHGAAPADEATVYRLDDSARFQEGCFDPCLCPLGEPLPVRGTFVLGPPVPGDVVDFRAISSIDWTVGNLGPDQHTLSGSGTYRVTNYGPPREHALDLSLSIDGAPPQTFFSDFQPLDGGDGRIDLQVSMFGLVCYDIAIRVVASPVPDSQILPYRLVRGSYIQQDCVEPCDCPPGEPRPVRGRFGLVELYDFGTVAEFALVQASITTVTDAVTASELAWRGYGRYTLIQGFAGPAHTMRLTLGEDRQAPWQFRSDLTNTRALFPKIDIVLDTTEPTCPDRVLTLRARPPAQVAPMPYQDAGPPRLR